MAKEEPEMGMDMLERNRLRLQFNFQSIIKKYENIDEDEAIEIDPMDNTWHIPAGMDKKTVRKQQERFYAVNENFGLSAISAPFNNAVTLEGQNQLMKKCEKRDKDFGKVLELTPYAEPTPKRNTKLVIRDEEQKYTCTGITVEELERKLRQDGISGDIFEKNENGGVASVTFKKRTTKIEDVDEEPKPGPSQTVLDAVERGFAAVLSGQPGPSRPLTAVQNTTSLPRVLPYWGPSTRATTTKEEEEEDVEDLFEDASENAYASAKSSQVANDGRWESGSDTGSIKSGIVMRSPKHEIKEEPLSSIGEADEDAYGVEGDVVDAPDVKIKAEQKDQRKSGGAERVVQETVKAENEEETESLDGVIQLSSDDEEHKARPFYSIFSRKRRASGRVFSPMSKKSRESDWDPVELPRSGDAPLDRPLGDFDGELLWGEEAGNVVDSFRSEKSSTVVGLGMADAARICEKSPKKGMLEMWADHAADQLKQQDAGMDYVAIEEGRTWRNARSRNQRLVNGYVVL